MDKKPNLLKVFVVIMNIWGEVYNVDTGVMSIDVILVSLLLTLNIFCAGLSLIPT